MNTQEFASILDQIPEEHARQLPRLLKTLHEQSVLKCDATFHVLAETEPEGEDIAGYLIDKGFENSSHSVPPDESYRPQADIVIFHRMSLITELKRVDNNYINAYIRSNKGAQILMYFGPYNDELDPKVERIFFTNFRQKLETNLLQILEDRREMKRASNEKAS